MSTDKSLDFNFGINLKTLVTAWIRENQKVDIHQTLVANESLAPPSGRNQKFSMFIWSGKKNWFQKYIPYRYHFYFLDN